MFDTCWSCRPLKSCSVHGAWAFTALPFTDFSPQLCHWKALSSTAEPSWVTPTNGGSEDVTWSKPPECVRQVIGGGEIIFRAWFASSGETRIFFWMGSHLWCQISQSQNGQWYQSAVSTFSTPFQLSGVIERPGGRAGSSRRERIILNNYIYLNSCSVLPTVEIHLKGTIIRKEEVNYNLN